MVMVNLCIRVIKMRGRRLGAERMAFSGIFSAAD